MQWMRLKVMYCGMAAKKMGMLAMSVRKIKALPAKVETVTLVDKGT